MLTYEIVGKHIGLGPQALGNHLGHIMNYCDRNGLPPLTILVVKKGPGRPGNGLTTTGNLDEDRERVFAHNWFGMTPLETNDLN